MAQLRKKNKVPKRKSKAGQAPGTLIFTGVKKMESTVLSLIEYKYAYFAVIGVMALSVLGVLWYFKSRQWI
ncbi:hypothetical protein [Pleomorphovibrio marinus]|uniref:hypothetical protein n=1 Tax=Pleomorphovibrio marinus TaxID=2164132 RepID=UPI000E0A8360|nr:hypothetical protein [Pleomorphovibrio marinus]